MSVTPLLYSTLPKHPLLFPSAHHSCCCTATSVQLPSLNSTAKFYSKQKLLQMICSLQKSYNQQLENKQTAYEVRMKELEMTMQGMRQESFDLRQRSAEKVNEVDVRREGQLLQRIDELERQNANIVGNKVSFIETNLTRRVHNLEHEVECERIRYQEEMEKVRGKLEGQVEERKRLVQVEKDERERIRIQNQKLKEELNRENGRWKEQGKEKDGKIRELERVNSCQELTILNQKEQISRIILEHKEKVNQLKSQHSSIFTKYQELLAEKPRMVEKMYDERLQFQRQIANSKFIKQQADQEKYRIAQKLQQVSMLLQQSRTEKQELDRRLHQLDDQLKVYKDQIERKDRLEEYLKVEKEEKQKFQRQLDVIRAEMKKKQAQVKELEESKKKSSQDWNQLYEKFKLENQSQIISLKNQITHLSQLRTQYQKLLAQYHLLQVEYQKLITLPKQKQYIYIQKLIHSQQGKLVKQKYLTLTTQHLTLQTSYKSIQFQNTRLLQSLNHYKSLQTIFNEQRERWRKQRQQLIFKYQTNEKDREGYTWTVERIIEAENHGEGVRVGENVKVIPDRGLPQVSYVVVGNEEELREHIRKGEEMRGERGRSGSKSRSVVREGSV